MKYKVNYRINDNSIHLQVIHNETQTYYESNVTNNDIANNIINNINHIKYDNKGKKLVISYNKDSIILDKIEIDYNDYIKIKKLYNK
jgi:hypothetical protein